MKKLLFKILPGLIIVLSIFSIQQWFPFTISSTILIWIVNFSILAIILILKAKSRHLYQIPISSKDNLILSFYFSWLIINTIRGAFIADNYWEWKQLIEGFQTLSLPLLVYIFSIPIITNRVLRMWLKYALLIFFILLFYLSKDAYQFYLGPIFLVGCFLCLLKKKWMIIIMTLLILMLISDLGARSQVIKSGIVILTAIGIYYRNSIPLKVLKITHWACYFIPIILLYLGISGTFNIFNGIASNEGKFTEKKYVNGQLVEDDLTVDTRSFIYQEVLTSAINHHYIIWGRTPARGNDSKVFGSFSAEVLKTGKYERHSNELCHTNVFTWLGLIGVILYSIIYLRSSYLALYKSNNTYIKYLACFIAFRWAFGWIEDFNKFDIANIALWMTISIGLSFKFRQMSNKEFSTYIKSLFI